MLDIDLKSVPQSKGQGTKTMTLKKCYTLTQGTGHQDSDPEEVLTQGTGYRDNHPEEVLHTNYHKVIFLSCLQLVACWQVMMG